MKKILFSLIFLITISTVACSQDHQKSEKWITNFKNIEKSTVVLNNDKQLIPFLNLEEKKNIVIVIYGSANNNIMGLK